MKLELVLQRERARATRRRARGAGSRSPPPEPADVDRLIHKHRKRPDKWAHVPAQVDTSAPALRRPRPAPPAPVLALRRENMRLLAHIREAQYGGGRVDCWWRTRAPPARVVQYERARVEFAARVYRENRRLHRVITTTGARLPATAALERWWGAARRERERRARGPWLLAPRVQERDPAFDAPPGVERPRVCLELVVRGGAAPGALRLELFADTCPRTAALFLALLAAQPGYVGTRFYSDMLVPEPAPVPGKDTEPPAQGGGSGPSQGQGQGLLVRVVSPDGLVFSALVPEDTLVEDLKHRAIEHFYPAGGAAARYKLVRVTDAGALHDMLSLAQEQLQPQEELLLVELGVGGGGVELGGLRGAAPGAVAAATAALPPPRRRPRAPDLQALLATNDLDHDLRKILISLVEAGARLAAAGPHYERALAQLRAALAPRRAAARAVQEVITPEEIALRVAAEQEEAPAAEAEPAGADAYRRADHLRRFLEAFRSWRAQQREGSEGGAVAALRELGYGAEEAETALARTGGSAPAAAAWLAGERGASVLELVDGLPDGVVLHKLLHQPQIQRGLLNTRMLAAFIGMVGRAGSAALWRASPRGSPLLAHISRTYHAEKYCLAVNQFSDHQDEPASSRRKVPGLYWSGGDVVRDCGLGRPEPPPALAALGPLEPENFHYPHSAPGLLTMHVDGDGEICGTFSVTFKPLQQFDLRSVVFGRVLFPSRTYEAMRSLGAALSSQPVVVIRAAHAAA